MRVGAAEAKRVYAHHTPPGRAVMRAVGLREWFERGVHAQLQSSEVDVRIRRGKMEIGWNLPVLEHEHRFHQAGDAGGGFQVAQVRLHRTNDQWRRGGCASPP